MLSSGLAARLLLLVGQGWMTTVAAQTINVPEQQDVTLSTPTQPLNVSIPNNSPLLTYRPNVTSGTPDLAWNITWSESPWPKWQEGALGTGRSAHVTYNKTAYVYFSFVGTQIHYNGKCPGCNLTLFIDKDSHFGLTNDLGEEGGIVASSPAMPFGLHTASLAIVNGTMELSNIIYTTELPTYNDVANETETAEVVGTVTNANGVEANNNDIQSSEAGGRVWETKQTLGLENVTSTPYPRIWTDSINGYAYFSTPTGASMVTLYGSMDYDHGPYTIEVTPTPPGQVRGALRYDGYSPWATKDAVLFSTILDPKRQYTVRMVNMDAGKKFDFSHAAFYVTNTTDPNPGGSGGGASDNSNSGGKGDGGLSGGAIAGIVVGSVVGGALLILLAWFLFRHRSGRDRAVLDDIDDIHDARGAADKAEISPFIMPGVNAEPKEGTTAANAQQRQAPGALNASDESVAYIAEEDAGPAPGYERERVQRVPPSYDPRWSEQVPVFDEPEHDLQGSPEEYDGDDYLQAAAAGAPPSSGRLSSDGSHSQALSDEKRRKSSTPTAASQRRQSSTLTTSSMPSEKRRHSSRASDMSDRRTSDTPSTVRRSRSTAKPPLVLAEMQRAMSGDKDGTPGFYPDRKLSDNTEDEEQHAPAQRKGSTYKPPLMLQSMFKVSEEGLNLPEEPPQIDPLDASGKPPSPVPEAPSAEGHEK
ncbi:hypothetical protein A1Q1_04753 [Trichosporon asahii var. asahii CBS 2479]|uniref:Uncharacterized protein n=1 Tax=Trichosporon asahii var. asahii (strain ATCC 90039 / CBS 2479 / JCM 2466 / KCTC 7840 / NBRC 103889/ NCYC 2677 / UAMH 7654) TaxID=1186058 RepID=J5SN87_TRIAS|nr:hypothetical protein A1Q1_04753 [Trichosporon asahii var. asahii CBS 2479]EJT46576.1 hypothetical protein A1Q1_04753 [Trichosporon asahii var. asahii CBS 2479]